MIKKFNEYITESSSDREIEIDGSKFGIKYLDLRDILFYITDEFPELDYYIDSAKKSYILNPDDHFYNDTKAELESDYYKNSFIIIFDKDRVGDDSDLLYYLEPRIFDMIKSISSQLTAYGLTVYSSDFGTTDSEYELVISKIARKIKKDDVIENIEGR